MSVNRWKLIMMPVLTLGLASPMLMNCGAVGDLTKAAGLPDVNCEGMETGDFTKLKISGGAQVEGKVKGFLNASYDLKKILVDMEAGLIASCGKLGTDLGMKAEEVKAEPDGGKGGEKVCAAVAAKIQGVLKANADAKLAIEVGAPKCYANVDVLTKCFGDCGSPIKGGELKASCQGGEISGKCEGECKGSCTAEAGAKCSGSCSATCEGKCDAGFKGTCGGKCDGKCDGKTSKGAKCEGTCDGKCDAEAKGSCTGTCDGSCSASCEVKAKGKCEGSCSGDCSVEIKEPKCSGEFVPPSVDPSCQLSCGAKGLASAKCEPPSVKITVNGKANADVEKLVGALQTSLPAILNIQLGTAKKIGATGAAVAKAAVDVKDVAASAGLSAGACIAMAVKASAEASLSIDVNVKASASVGGSVGTGG
jgi:hypothetical protein